MDDSAPSSSVTDTVDEGEVSDWVVVSRQREASTVEVSPSETTDCSG